MGAGKLTGVGVDATWQVDGHHQPAVLPGQVGQTGRLSPQAPGAADAHQPVDDEIGSGHRLGRVAGDPATRSAQSRQSLRVGAVGTGEHGVDARPSTGQPRPRVQGVPAVVSGTHEQRHAGRHKVPRAGGRTALPAQPLPAA